MRAVYLKEVKTFFNTLSGYIFIALYLLGGGLIFAMTNLVEGSAKMAQVLLDMRYVLFIITPILTMRLFAGKYGSRKAKGILADRTLLSAPVRTRSIVAGKFFSAATVLFAAVTVSFVYPVILLILGTPSLGEIASGYLGLLLFGGMLISIGMFVSVFASGRTAAGSATLVTMLLILLAENLIPVIGSPWLRTALLKAMPLYHLFYFESGIISLTSLIYFFSLTALLLFLTERVIELKRRS